MKLPLPLQSYPARSVKQNSQNLVNMFAVGDSSGGQNQQLILYPSSGLSLFSDTIGTEVRALKEVRGVCYVVKNAIFGTINSGGTFTSIGALGTTSGRVSMASIFDQIMIVTGTTAYLYVISTNTFSTISDVDLPASVTQITSMDDYFIALKPDSDTFYISAQSDGSSWSATQFASAETRSDNLVAALTIFQELWLIGQQTTEIWFDTGNTFPFERQDGSFINAGCIAPYSVVMANNTAYWLSRSTTGQGKVITISGGSQPETISTEAMHNEFNTYDTLADCFAFSYQKNGYEFIVFTFPTANKTWELNLNLKLWNKLNSYDLINPQNTPSYTRHRSNCYCFCYEKHLVGDYVSGKVFELAEDVYVDDSVYTIQREITTPDFENSGEVIRCKRLELFIETGQGLASPTAQGYDPEIRLQVSTDGGFTFGNSRKAKIGKLGTYRKRVLFTNLGRARNFVFRFIMSEPIKFIVLGAWVHFESRPMK